MKLNPEILDDRQNFFATGILPDYNYRFVLARNSAVTKEIAKVHGASDQAAALIGEVMTGAYFLASHSLKQELITISLHLECEGPIKRIMGYANSSGGIRGLAASADAVWDGPLAKGKKRGIITVHKWIDQINLIYSSSVEMRDVPVEKNLEEYLGKSEQIQSFIKIRSRFESGAIKDVSGYLFQALPEASFEDSDRVAEMVNAADPHEMLDGILYTDINMQIGKQPDEVFRNARILKTGKFYHYCGCSRKKVQDMIISMGRDSAEETIQSEGFIEAQCEFCKTKYQFTPEEIYGLFDDGK